MESNLAVCRQAVNVIKAAILKSQARAALSVTQEQLALYYGIGRFVSQNSRKNFWGMDAIGNISRLLREELPGLKGFSAENIKLMRRFYEAWDNLEPNSVVRTTELPDENPSVGIILCKKANKSFVEYVLQDYVRPMGVATYQTNLDKLKALLPPEEELKKLIPEA